MKGRLIGVLMVCAVLLWSVSPAWSDDIQQPRTFKIEQAAAEAPAAQPAETPDATQQAAPAASETSQAPETAPAAEAVAAQPPADQGGIQIEDAVVCQDVVDRMPIGSGDVFPKETARVFCYTRVVGLENGGAITHNWYYKGTLKASIKLPVRSNNWRTWSSKSMIPEWSGEWMVEVLSDDGKPLESIIFFMQ